MAEKPTVDVVCKALKALYDNPDNKGRAEASQFLTEVQNSPFAWEIADQLLRLNSDNNSRYFAAHTMRSKVYYSFSELSSASQVSLRDSLLSYLSSLQIDHAPTQTQLALAIADVAVQMSAWENPVNDVIQELAKGETTLPALIDILLLLPEEMNCEQLTLGENRRCQIMAVLQSSSDTVLGLLQSCIQMYESNVDLQLKILHCFSSWLYLNTCSPAGLAQSQLMALPFLILSNGELDSRMHTAAADCICAALFICEDCVENEVLAKHLQAQVFGLFTAYQRAIANEDTDHAVSLCRVFTEMGEAFINYLVHSPNEGLGDFTTLALIIECCKHSDYEIAEKTFNFWYHLSEKLSSCDDIKLWDQFRPQVEALIVALCSQCSFDEDRRGLPSKQDDFVEFREQAAEIVRDIIFAVGPLTCFKKLYGVLQAHGSWAEAEAAIFFMQAIADRIDAREDEIVALVLPIVLNLPGGTHVLLRHAALRLIGQLAHWINEYHRIHLESTLATLVQALVVPELASEVAFALNRLCQACRRHMLPHVDGLIQIPLAVSTSGSLSLPNSAIISLIQGICDVISLLPPEKVTEEIRKLSQLATGAIQLIISGAADQNVDISVHVDRLAAIFRFTRPEVLNASSGSASVQHPCQPVAEEAWPVLSALCVYFQSDAKVMERWCRCMRYILRCLGRPHSVNLISQLANQMVSVYAAHPHSCFLYLAGVLVDEYGDLPDCVPGFLDMFRAFCPDTFKLLSEPDGFVRHPDTVDDLFRLCARLALRLPVPFLSLSDVIPTIMECALTGLLLHHKEAHASVCRFLFEVIHCPMNGAVKSHEEIDLRLAHLDQLLSKYGLGIMRQIVSGCVGKMPKYTFPDLGDLIWEIMKMFPKPTSDWLSTALADVLVNEEKAGGGAKATKEQLLSFHSKVINAKDPQDIWDALKHLSRLFR